MYYIEKNNKDVVKYDCVLNEERIKEIREEIINNYSSIIKIRNFNCLSNLENIETDRIKNYYNKDSKVSFDYYIYPEFVYLIDMLLDGNISVLDEIIYYKLSKFSRKKLGNINLSTVICNDISNNLNINFSVNDLFYYLNDENNLNINNLDYNHLKEQLIKCISFTKISSISLNDFYQMMEFLNLDSKDVLNNKTNSVKKRERKKEGM